MSWCCPGGTCLRGGRDSCVLCCVERSRARPGNRPVSCLAAYRISVSRSSLRTHSGVWRVAAFSVAVASSPLCQAVGSTSRCVGKSGIASESQPCRDGFAGVSQTAQVGQCTNISRHAMTMIISLTNSSSSEAFSRKFHGAHIKRRCPLFSLISLCRGPRRWACPSSISSAKSFTNHAVFVSLNFALITLHNRAVFVVSSPPYLDCPVFSGMLSSYRSSSSEGNKEE